MHKLSRDRFVYTSVTFAFDKGQKRIKQGLQINHVNVIATYAIKLSLRVDLWRAGKVVSSRIFEVRQSLSKA